MDKFTLSEKRSSAIVGVITCVFVLSACLGPAAPEPTSAPTMVPRRTATPTDAPVPDHFPVEDVTERYGYPLDFNPDFVTLPAGTYLIGEDRSRNELYYFTMDGAVFGQIGKFPSLSVRLPDGVPSSYLTSDFSNQSYLKIYSSNWFDVGRTETTSGSGRVLVQNVDLVSKKMRMLMATVRVERDMLCQGDYISPDGHWLAGSCWKDGENYLYLLDIASGTGEYLYSSQYPCQMHDATPWGGWVGLDWSVDGKALHAQCRDETRGFYMFCSISLESGVFSCQRSNYYQHDIIFYPWSPDGSKVAVRVIPGGEQRLSYLFVTDSECALDFHSCTEYVRAQIGDGESLYYSVGAIWARSGERFIWTHYPLTAGSIQQFTKINIANISTGVITSFDGPRGADLLGISPDDQWLVLRNDEDLMLLSMNGQTLRRLPRPGDRPASFLGWLVIP